jgi:hypothetical protein
MPPKVSFLLHEATTVNKVSSTSQVHSEPADVREAHLPTEQDSVFLSYTRVVGLVHTLNPTRPPHRQPGAVYANHFHMPAYRA